MKKGKDGRESDVWETYRRDTPVEILIQERINIIRLQTLQLPHLPFTVSLTAVFPCLIPRVPYPPHQHPRYRHHLAYYEPLFLLGRAIVAPAAVRIGCEDCERTC